MSFRIDPVRERDEFTYVFVNTTAIKNPNYYPKNCSGTRKIATILRVSIKILFYVLKVLFKKKCFVNL